MHDSTTNSNCSASGASLKVYFDGLCYLCSSEIAHYQKQLGAEAIKFIDITQPGFSAIEEGLDPILVHQIMHAKDSQGRIITGVAAFIAIWQVLPKYQRISRVAAFPPIFAMLKVAYRCFAMIRPLLPKRNCNDSPYCGS